MHMKCMSPTHTQIYTVVEIYKIIYIYVQCYQYIKYASSQKWDKVASLTCCFNKAFDGEQRISV